MADFCRDCTFDLCRDDEHVYAMAQRNDFVGFGGAWGLCEGCGSHRFDDGGRRVCRMLYVGDDLAVIEPCALCADAP